MNELKKASAWLKEFESRSAKLISYLKTIYGNDSSLVERKILKYLKVLSEFISVYGDRDVVISRAPGRINLMGRHVEHRGGNINTIAIHKETIMVAAPREDDTVAIANTDKRFGSFSFSIPEEMNIASADDWMDYIDSKEVKDHVAKLKGQWVNYVKGAVLRFQYESDKKLKGMDIMCLGTVPVAGGVSSSSSIIMATSELLYKINGFNFETPAFIDICGQSEWYVGSRGGAGDHAAIKCGVLDSFSPIAFEPIHVLGSIEIPTKYSIVVANSFIEAKKSEGAKDKFNQMVAAYEFGVMLIKKNYPEFKDRIIHLRDINPKTLEVTDDKIYEMLLSIPLFIKPDELYKEIPEEYHKKVEKITSSHIVPDYYNLRSAVLFGIAECERSRICSSLLKEGKINEFAEIMNISHNGDRIAKITGSDIADYDYYITDDKLKELIKRYQSGDSNAALYKQPGGYGCSITEIDVLIDKVLKQKGVLSSQISGAGLGGCIMILCEKAHEQSVLEFLRKEYYIPNGFPNGALIVRPIKGSMCLDNI